MSLSAKSATRKVSAIRDRYNAAEALDEIQDFLNGCYDLASLNSWEIDQDFLNLYEESNREERKALLAGKSLLSKAMAYVWSSRGFVYQDGDYVRSPMTFSEVLKKAKIQRAIVKWMSKDIPRMKELGCWEHRPFPEALEALGVSGAKTAALFCDLYEKVYNPCRVWLSSCQVSQVAVAKVALNRNLQCLPEWVRIELINAPDHANIHGDRQGDVWRLIPCVKAWKWCHQLPKRVAEKVGKLSPKMRMLAACAWNGIDESSEVSAVNQFWANLHELQKAPLTRQIDLISNGWFIASDPAEMKATRWGKRRWAAFLSESLGLPHGFVEVHHQPTYGNLLQTIAQYGNPERVCKELFGGSGKATLKAFQNSTQTAWRWASALCDRNPDAAQKIMGMTEMIEFEPDAIEFLKSLPMQSRIRLLGATTFKYRGVVNPISPDHVRDTGYLWKNIQQVPDLGRVRCWFSVHETLAAAFVKELPDEALPIPSGWDRVDGLCAVDASWSLEFPKRVATLKYYGEALRNCVGGYGPAIKSGRSVIFVVREHGLLTHCVEISSGYVNQFYRTGNSSPDYAVKDSVCEALRQANLID